MTHELDPPPGWRFAAYPGWSLDDPEDRAFLPDLVQIGHVLLPEFFYLAAGTPGMWPTDESPYPGADDFIVLLHFQAKSGELRLREIRGAGDDLVTSLDAFRKAVPAKLWKPIAVREMTEFLALVDATRDMPDSTWAPVRTDEWVETIREHRAKALHPSARPKRRNRITDAHLKAVASEYLAADTLGMPPTKAVAEYFQTSHSTAAKWVGAARRKGYLPPADKTALVNRRSRVQAELKEADERLEEELKKAEERLAVETSPAVREKLEMAIRDVKRDLARRSASNALAEAPLPVEDDS